MGSSARVALVASAVVALAAACGSTGDDAAPGSSPPSGEPTAPTSPGADRTSSVTTSDAVAPAAEVVERCDDVPPTTTDVLTGPAADSDAVIDAVRSIWPPEGPDSDFAGTWVDREAGGTTVVAVTGDAERHRAAIVELLADPETPFDVVEVEFSERTIIDTVPVALRAASAVAPVASAANDVRRNRVRLESSDPLVDDDLAAIASALEDAGVAPLAMVCVAAPSPDELPPTIEPGTPLDLAVEPDGDWPADTTVSCLGVEFQLATLGGLRPALDADAGLLDVARPWLGGDGWAPELWRWTVLDDERAMFLSVTTGVSIHLFERARAGWIWSDGVSSGICRLEAVLPAGLDPVDWEVDPVATPLPPESTAIPVLATERSCAGGQPVGDRLLGPQVVENDDAVLVVFAAITQRGDQTCPGNPATPVTIELARPLGDRVLRDGRDVGPITDLVAPMHR